ncbi:hypothetical protein [Arcticibacter eurypsychrophilus]|uniref:hypothetical protein n=1 Tax=Arcticibacter eurypsychrophilus TaxID=1434752 RepID=UPI00084D32AC|nr:hypothetical protein [Arcticibacter eurypsychrophilus]
MKNIFLIFGFILSFLFTDKVSAQTIGFSGPTTDVASGTRFVFTATGETARKFIGTVPRNPDATVNNSLESGVQCWLYTTNYFNENHVGGQFTYTLTNTNSVAKTVVLKFLLTMSIYDAKGNLSNVLSEWKYVTVTINPAPATPQSVPIYLVQGGVYNSETYLSTDGSTSGGWSNRGIAFKAYNQPWVSLGIIPIYEFTGKAFDSDGTPGLQGVVRHYSRSNQLPTVPLYNAGSLWDTTPPKVAFYAYATQVPGTVPLYRYSYDDTSKNMFTYSATGDVASSFIQNEIVCYVYPNQ